jgi:hypothetical protein
MSKQREALQVALQALEEIAAHYPADWEFDICVYAKTLLREALAEPEQEPVGIVRTVGGYPDDSTHTVEWLVKHKELRDGDKLYTAPPQRKPLTDEEIDNLELPPNGCTMRELVRAIERAHGIGES